MLIRWVETYWTFREVTLRAKSWYLPYLELIRICKDLIFQFCLVVWTSGNFMTSCKNLWFYFFLPASVGLVLPRMFLEDTSSHLFLGGADKAPSELVLFGFSSLVFGFSSFFPFVDWTGLADFVERRIEKTGCIRSLGRSLPRNSFCALLPPVSINLTIGSAVYKWGLNPWECFFFL